MQFIRLVAIALIVFPASYAKDKKPKKVPKDPQDSIEVVGHIPLADGPVTRFITTQHYNSYYLYVEHGGGKTVSLIDVTQIAKPKIIAEMPASASGGPASLFAVAGTAALITAAVATAPGSSAQTVRIMDFSDPLHPQVAHEFTGVTSMSRDEHRGLIFVANGEGIWVLHQTYAEDPEVQREYARRILYDH